MAGRKARALQSRRRKQLIKMYGRCLRCGCKDESKLEAHHIRPLSCGGSSRITNFTLLCTECHKIVDDEALEQYGSND